MKNGKQDNFKILVGVDFSPTSLGALDRAVALARRLDARLELVHVFPPGSVPPLASLIPSHDAVENYLRVWREFYALGERVPPEIPMQLHIRLGHPVRGLLDAIDLLAPDMVIVGSHGYGPVRGAFMGSVSARLAQRSPAPVLVVPAEQHWEAATQGLDAVPVEGSIELALACHHCGAIAPRGGATHRCSQCGTTPAKWDAAPILAGPVDVEAPAVGESVGDMEIRPPVNEPMALFSTSPPGAEGYDINPELRVRY